MAFSSIKQGIRRLAQDTVAWAVGEPKARFVLNRVYQSLLPAQQAWFHREFAKLFRDRPGQGKDGVWPLTFSGRLLVAPLGIERLWLDWDTAVSILGHDVEIKETYKSLLTAPKPPELFVDIGANYGTHSLLFLLHGVETLTFEPNPNCHEYFREICVLNQVDPSLVPVALGSVDSSIDLYFPTTETWLGTTHTQTRQFLESQLNNLQVMTVEQHSLDRYYTHFVDKRALIKIDTEGSELAILQGATRVLQEFTPTIIFEAWMGEPRKELWSFLQSFGYSLHALPLSLGKPRNPLRQEQFCYHPTNNFLALSQR